MGGEGDGYEDRGHEVKADVEAELFELVAQAVPVEGEEVVEHGEVDTAEEHGQGDDVLLEVGEVGEAVVVDGEPAGGDVGEGDVDGVPQLHAAFAKQEDEEEREQDVHAEGLADGGGCGGGLFACVVGSGGFGGVEAVFVDAHGGDEGQHKEDNAKAAEPLGHAAPQEDGGGQPLDRGEDGGPGAGDAAHGFEEGVGEAG